MPFSTRPSKIEPDFEVMDRATLDRYRGYSRARSGPWDTHYVEMAEKTVLKQLLKRLPKSVTAPPEPPPELLMAGYDLVAPDGLEGVINNPALQEGVPVPEIAAQAEWGDCLEYSQRQRCHGRNHRRTPPERIVANTAARPMTKTTRRFRRRNDGTTCNALSLATAHGSVRAVAYRKDHRTHNANLGRRNLPTMFALQTYGVTPCKTTYAKSYRHGGVW